MRSTSKQTTSENAVQLDFTEAVHEAFSAEKLRRGGKPLVEFSKLDEATKRYYRATIRAVLAVQESQKTSEILAWLRESDKVNDGD